MNKAFSLIRSPYSKHIIIEPDFALWNFHADRYKKSISIKHTRNSHKTYSVLKLFSSTDSNLYVCSRSTSQQKTNLLLARLYPELEWNDIHTDWKSSKIKQIESLIGYNERFMLFDYSPHVLSGVKRHFQDKCKVFLSSELGKSVLMEYEESYISTIPR